MSLIDQINELLTAAQNLASQHVHTTGEKLKHDPEKYAAYVHEIKRCAGQFETARKRLAFWSYRLEKAIELVNGKDNQNDKSNGTE